MEIIDGNGYGGYRQMEGLPREERHSRTSQLRRARVSVSSNIAEGKGRSSDNGACTFLTLGQGLTS